MGLNSQYGGNCAQFSPTHTHPTPLQARIVGLNSQYFLKNGGNYVISIKASCIDSTAPPEAVFAREVKKLQEQQLKPKEQVGVVGLHMVCGYREGQKCE